MALKHLQIGHWEAFAEGVKQLVPKQLRELTVEECTKLRDVLQVRVERRVFQSRCSITFVTSFRSRRLAEAT